MPRNKHPRVRYRPARARARLERFLQTRCFICLNSPSEHPSKRLPCCAQFIHEECLWSCFQYAKGELRDTCPHCRFLLTPYNSSEDIPNGTHPFRFDHVRYPPPPPPPSSNDWYFEYYGIPADDYIGYYSVPVERYIDYDEDSSDRQFLNPPLASPPPGWAAFRRSNYR